MVGSKGTKRNTARERGHTEITPSIEWRGLVPVIMHRGNSFGGRKVHCGRGLGWALRASIWTLIGPLHFKPRSNGAKVDPFATMQQRVSSVSRRDITTDSYNPTHQSSEDNISRDFNFNCSTFTPSSRISLRKSKAKEYPNLSPRHPNRTSPEINCINCENPCILLSQPLIRAR